MEEGEGTTTAEHATSEIKETYPPDLISAIAEARRFNRVEQNNPRLTQRLIKGGLENAEWFVTEGRDQTFKTAEDWALYNAIKGKVAEMGDFLELARINPQLAGNISPGRMFAILAIAHEKAISSIDTSLEFTSHYLGKAPEEETISQQLDQRNFLKDQALNFRTAAGEEYATIKARADSPQFATFLPRVGYALNPQFLSKK